MHVLITGRGGAGSWTIRAEQIGRELDAKVKANATLEDCRLADVIIVVKKIPPALWRNVMESHRPWAYDILDAYPQPECSAWDEAYSKAWLANFFKRLKATAVIFPNERMMKDSNRAGHVIPHHFRPGIKINPIRERMSVIGYEGSAKYIEGWRPIIEAECRKRDMTFVVNPENLADVDVVLAMRDGRHNGYPQQRWKSNVKLANAHGSGTPFIGMPEDGYIETSCGAEYWAETQQGLSTALDWLEPYETRKIVSERFLKHAISISDVAKQYRDVLCALKS